MDCVPLPIEGKHSKNVTYVGDGKDDTGGICVEFFSPLRGRTNGFCTYLLWVHVCSARACVFT